MTSTVAYVRYAESDDAAFLRLRLRPAGPAGPLITRLPGDLVLVLDRAEPRLVLEVAADLASEVRREVAVAVSRLLLGDAIAQLVVDKVTGQQTVDLPHGRLRDDFVRLCAVAATSAERSALGRCVLAGEAAELAHAIQGDTTLNDLDRKQLSALLTEWAQHLALQSVSVLRELPNRDRLRLSHDAAAVLDRMVATVRDFVGDDVALGPVADGGAVHERDEAPHEAFTDIVAEFDRLLAEAAAAVEDEEVLLGGTLSSQHDTRSRTPAIVLDNLGPELDLIVLAARTGSAENELELAFRIAASRTQRTLPDLRGLNVWCRVVDEFAAVLRTAACEPTGAGEFVVAVPIGYQRATLDFTLDLTRDPLTPAEALRRRAQRHGRLATWLTQRVESQLDWLAVADAWGRCARALNRAGDDPRSDLAVRYRLRALRAAGRERDWDWGTGDLVYHAADPVWLAPAIDEAALADPLHLAQLLPAVNLVAAVDGWAISDWLSSDAAQPRLPLAADPGNPDVHVALVRAWLRAGALALPDDPETARRLASAVVTHGLDSLGAEDERAFAELLQSLWSRRESGADDD